MKSKAIKILTFDIKDILMDIVIEHKDLTKAWMALQWKYKSRDPTIVFNLNYKLIC